SAIRYPLQPLQDRFPRRPRPQAAPNLLRRLPRLDRGDDGALDGCALLAEAEVLEHHRGAEDGTDRVGHVLPRVLRGAAVDRLDERDAAGVDVAARGHAEAALQRGAE